MKGRIVLPSERQSLDSDRRRTPRQLVTIHRELLTECLRLAYRRPNTRRARSNQSGWLLVDGFGIDQLLYGGDELGEWFGALVAVLAIADGYLSGLCFAVAHDEHVRNLL